jgi:hypothetical protein
LRFFIPAAKPATFVRYDNSVDTLALCVFRVRGTDFYNLFGGYLPIGSVGDSFWANKWREFFVSTLQIMGGYYVSMLGDAPFQSV